MSNQEMRKHLVSLSFSEKVKILEKLRDRSLAIAAAGLRQKSIDNSDKGPDKRQRFCTCLGWEPCACGNQPPYHCMLCCLELTPEQIAAARLRGFYRQEGIEE